MGSNRGCIPEEILFEIFTRLPVKSLCRFRCVSKLCFSIISDPDFVTAHLARSRSRPKLLISFQYFDPLRHKDMCAFFSIDYPHQDSSAQPLRATSHCSTESSDWNVISSSPSGLICFGYPSIVKFGNPTTGDFDVIPYTTSGPLLEPQTIFLFGFDRVEKSHVILKLEQRYGILGNHLPEKSSLFDLVDKCWHDTQPHPWLDVSSVNSDICINGVIYFMAYSSEMVNCLHAFDVRLRSFQNIFLPPDSLLGQSFCVELVIDYKGRVAFVGDGDLEGTIEDEIKMWILEDLENHIWSFKSFVVPWRDNLIRDGVSIDGMRSWDLNNSKVRVVGATHRGELILATSLWNRPSYLFFYEIEIDTLRRFEVDGFDNIQRGNVIFEWVTFNWVVESLESPKGFNNKEKEESCPH